MSAPVQPSPPNVELELAHLAARAMAAGGDAHAITGQLHDAIAYLRQFPKVAQDATGALTHGISIEDISNTMAPHVRAFSNAQRASTAPTAAEAKNLPADKLDPAAQVLANVANLSHDIPGAEAAQAGVRSIVQHQPYAEALNDIQQAENQIPGVLRGGERFGGGVLAASAIPGGPALSGARYGVLHGLLSSDPNQSVADRLHSAAAEGAIGAVTGKAADLGGTAVRALGAKTPDAIRVALQNARTAASRPLYAAFRNLGDLGQTPQLTALLGDGTPANPGLPVVRRAVDAVKGESPNLAQLPDTHAEVLDAVYKIIGNKAFKQTNGITTDEARSALLDAIENAAQGKGGSYSEPVGVFKQFSKQMGAVARGKEALNNAASPGGGGTSADLTKSPAAFSDWLEKASTSPEEKQGAVQGILGQVNRRGIMAHAFNGRVPIPFPSTALRAAGPLLQAAQQAGGQTPGGLLADLLRSGAVSQSAQLNPF